MMTKLIYPTLDLFLYDLREGLGQTQDDIQQNRRRFLQKLPTTIDEQFLIQLDEHSFEPEYLELLGAQQRYSEFESESHEGYYYPVRLSDTYGLLLDCSLKAAQSDDDLTWLHDLRVYVTDKLKEPLNTLEQTQQPEQLGSLGQTWLFSAQVPEVPTVEWQALAKRCYETLIPGADWVGYHTEHSTFLGGSLFEFWQYASPEQTALSHRHHVMIVLYPDEQAAKTAAKCYSDWMRLLMYRHKILWAYHQSRQLKQQLKAQAVTIQTCRQEISDNHTSPLNFDALQKILQAAWETLPLYTTNLSDLKAQIRTIEINLMNYRNRLTELEKKTGQPLTLKNFVDKTQQKYLRQVQADHENLQPNLTVLENLINYIRTTVAIVEEKRERAFQHGVATGGIGLAVGAIVASISGQFPTLNQQAALNNPVGSILACCLPPAWVAPFISVVLSVAAAFVAGLLTHLWISKKKRWHR